MEKCNVFDRETCLRVGTFVNTHGIRGDIKVYPHTDDINRFLDLEYVYMDTKEGILKCDIGAVKFFKNMAIIRFKGVNNINDIEKYKGSDLLITREQAVPLEENEYFICDVIGSKVITDEGEEIGIVKDVLQTGANDVYVVNDKENEEILIPVIPSCVLDMDLDNKIVKIHLLEGLLEINKKK